MGKRERKPKIYASYAVEGSCDLHSKKLAKVEKQREREIEEQRSRRRKNSFRRNVSASPSRAGSRAEGTVVKLHRCAILKVLRAPTKLAAEFKKKEKNTPASEKLQDIANTLMMASV